jgi:hypothetical protein
LQPGSAFGTTLLRDGHTGGGLSPAVRVPNSHSPDFINNG